MSNLYSKKDYYKLAKDIKSNMKIKLDLNSSEVLNWDINNRKNGIVSAYWLLGFMEAEVTFGIKSLIPYFQICQHKCNLSTFELIKDYLIRLSSSNSFNYSIKLPIDINISVTLNKKTNVYTYAISNIDSLYYYILPFFYNLVFKSRKGVDFELWRVGVLLYKRGYFYNSAGIKLLLLISSNRNKKRYSTNLNTPTLDKFSIDEVFKLNPPIKEDLLNFKPHTELVKGITSYRGK